MRKVGKKDTMQTLRKLYDGFFNVVKYLCAAIMLVMVGIVIYSVFMRYVMNDTPRWGDEMALFCMIWFCLLSASWAFKENRHIRIEFWASILPPRIYWVMELIVHLLALAVFVVLTHYSLKMLTVIGNSKMTGSGLPMAALYAAEPVSIFCMAVAAVGRIGEILGRKF